MVKFNYRALSQVLKYAETTEDDFHALLDANPNDHHTRLVFADWLQERDDPRAAGYRALGKLQKQPTPYDIGGHSKFGQTQSGLPFIPHIWTYWNEQTSPIEDELPIDWRVLIKNHPDHVTLNGRDATHKSSTHTTRREAEDAAAHAFSKLPPDRQQELLK